MIKHQKKKSSLTAARFRLTLLVGVIVLIVGIVAGYSFGIQQLRKYAVAVSHSKADALASNDNVQTLQQLDEQLTSYQDVLEKAKSLKLSGDFPEFRIVEEVQAVAARHGIVISSYSYGGDSSSGGGEAVTDTSSTTAPSTTTAAPSPAAGGNTISLTVNISSPVDYKKLLRFLHDVQHHVPTMEMGGVSISPASSGSGVSVEAISIQMYVNK